jgi:hypothetical protein
VKFEPKKLSNRKLRPRKERANKVEWNVLKMEWCSDIGSKFFKSEWGTVS